MESLYIISQVFTPLGILIQGGIMILYDFEVFMYDHLAVFIDTDTHMIFSIVNDDDAFKQLYEDNKNNIWVGFNNKHYDQYVYKSIILGINPKRVSDMIILEGKDGWQISREFNKIPMINYDVFGSKAFGLKVLEGFMGNNIKETSVPFNINRKLTEEEIKEIIKYCTWDVENTGEVFMENIDTFNAFLGLIQAFPKELSIFNISDSSAQITANVLQCERQPEWNDEMDFYFLPCIKIDKYKEVVEWFSQFIGKRFESETEKRSFYKETSLTINVAGVPHKQRNHCHSKRNHRSFGVSFLCKLVGPASSSHLVSSLLMFSSTQNFIPKIP